MKTTFHLLIQSPRALPRRLSMRPSTLISNRRAAHHLQVAKPSSNKLHERRKPASTKHLRKLDHRAHATVSSRAIVVAAYSSYFISLLQNLRRGWGNSIRKPCLYRRSVPGAYLPHTRDTTSHSKKSQALLIRR